MRGVGDQGVVAWQPSRDGLTCAARRHCPSGPSPIAVVRAGCTRVAGRTREPDCAEGLRRLHPGVGTSDRRMPATIPTGATRCSSRSPSIPASAVSIHLGRTRSPPAGRGENRPPAAGRLATICADSRVRVHTNNAGPGIACAETLHAIVVGRAGVASGSWNSWSRESGGWSCHFFSLGGWWAGRRSPVRCCLWRGPLVGRSPTALEPGGAARRWCLRQPTSCRPGPRGVMRSAVRVFGRGAGNYAGAFLATRQFRGARAARLASPGRFDSADNWWCDKQSEALPQRDSSCRSRHAERAAHGQATHGVSSCKTRPRFLRASCP